MGFNLIYWNPMGGCYFWLGSNLEKFRKTVDIRLDWGNTARADMAGLGSIGLIKISAIIVTIGQFECQF